MNCNIRIVSVGYDLLVIHMYYYVLSVSYLFVILCY